MQDRVEIAVLDWVYATASSRIWGSPSDIARVRNRIMNSLRDSSRPRPVPPHHHDNLPHDQGQKSAREGRRLSGLPSLSELPKLLVELLMDDKEYDESMGVVSRSL